MLTSARRAPPSRFASPSAPFARSALRAFTLHSRDRRALFSRSHARRHSRSSASSNARASASNASPLPSAVSVPLAGAYAALAYVGACNAFMWALDLTAPIIETPAPFVIGRLCVAIGATTLAALNFYPQAKKQLGLAWSVVANARADMDAKKFAFTFALKVLGKMVCEFYGYWLALTKFTPCSVSMELSAYYAVAFLGHAAFVAASGKVLGASGAIETIPRNVQVLIGSFDLVLAGLCVATSRLAIAGAGVASAASGVAFLALALYFTFENKQKPSKASAVNA